MVEHLDQDQKLQRRRTLRAANELFLKLLEAELARRAVYDAEDDFAKSIDEAYAEIRARVAAGGKGWTPP
jgi:hypothetical protein